MKNLKRIALAGACLASVSSLALAGDYDPSPEHPFGRPNPAAPAELSQFDWAIGSWQCQNERLGPDGEWQVFPFTWVFGYELNGMAISDDAEGATNYHIVRQFDSRSKTWKHTLFGMNGRFERYILEGTFHDGIMTLASEPAVGADGKTRHFSFVFDAITGDSFNWTGLLFTGDQPLNFSNISCQRTG